MEQSTLETDLPQSGVKVQRKRRLSKKERKAQKRKKQQITETIDRDEKGAPETKAREGDDQELMESYEPISVPTVPSAEVLMDSNDQGHGKNVQRQSLDNDEGGGGGERRLGAWFPNALVVKCDVGYTNTGELLLSHSTKRKKESEIIKKGRNPKSALLLFYQYTTKEKWTTRQVQLLMTYICTIAKQRNLGGRIRVAQEGVNATLSAVDLPYQNGLSASAILRHVAQDLKNFDPEVFTSKTDFKFIDNISADRHFKELKIIPVQELVYYGIRGEDVSCNEGGIHLDAEEYHKMLQKDNTVVIDVRNHYETILGRFDGQQSKKPVNPKENKGAIAKGAEYIDPKMRKSTDFTSWLSQPETKAKLENKTVLMYCTGGVRCERASAYLKKEMAENVKGVYQLQGGIERYLKAYPDGGFWTGKNFVFDKREAVSALEKNGCGGVLPKGKKGKNGSVKDGGGPSKCCVCKTSWDRYVGKKKCFTCGVPVLMCDQCMTKKFDKDPKTALKVRCPLCVEENITVPASKAQLTDNGVKNKNIPDISGSGRNDQTSKKEKAASSVCKWGGGHAKRKKLSQMMCRFGKDCVRKDCFFAHPK